MGVSADGARRRHPELGYLGMAEETPVNPFDNFDDRAAVTRQEPAFSRPFLFQLVAWHVGCQQPKQTSWRIGSGRSLAWPRSRHDPDEPSPASKVSGSTGFHGLMRCTP